MQSQLELRSPVTRFNESGNYAFEDVCLLVSKGELIAIIGRSGCGNSTMFNIAAGLSESTSGSVWVNGERAVRPHSGAIYVFLQYRKSYFSGKWLSRTCFSREVSAESQYGEPQGQSRSRCEA